jgi:hypothetical protein
MSTIKIFIQNINISFDLNGRTHKISSHHVKYFFQIEEHFTLIYT